MIREYSSDRNYCCATVCLTIGHLMTFARLRVWENLAYVSGYKKQRRSVSKNSALGTKHPDANTRIVPSKNSVRFVTPQSRS
jgi:hypothetical protein